MNQFHKSNLFVGIPRRIGKEISKVLLERPGLSIQRIVSQGQATGWLEQDTDEWVVLLAGAARLLFEEGSRRVSMRPGEHVYIPAGCRHRVTWTDPDHRSVWLAVHYKARKAKDFKRQPERGRSR